MPTHDSLSLFRPSAIAAHRAHPTAEGRPRLSQAIARLMLWRRRYNDRRTIRAMTSEQIADLDLDPIALRREGEKPFWRA